MLLLEKKWELPSDGSTLDVAQVIYEGRFKARETWLDGRRRNFAPEEHFNVGGKTKWYGAAVLRYSPHEFEADPDHQCLAWPIGYRDLEPYYDEAERLLGVRLFPAEANLTSIARRIRHRNSGWKTEPLPLALSPEIINHPEEARRFDAFASVKGLKADAERVFIDPIRSDANFRLHIGDAVAQLIPDDSDSRRVNAVVTESGKRFECRTLILAAGALHSPRLLQNYLATTGLDRRLPSAAVVGRNYKQHLLTAMIGFGSSPQTDVLRKTLIFLHEKLPHSSVQPLGFDGELIAGLMPKLLPRRLATRPGQYAYGFFLQTEDGSHPANRVIAGTDARAPQLDYDPRRLPRARLEHRRLVRALGRGLLRANMLVFSRPIPLSGTAHACGSLVMGNDPASSVRGCARTRAWPAQSLCRRRQRAAALEPR